MIKFSRPGVPAISDDDIQNAVNMVENILERVDKHDYAGIAHLPPGYRMGVALYVALRNGSPPIPESPGDDKMVLRAVQKALYAKALPDETVSEHAARVLNDIRGLVSLEAVR